MTTYRKPSKRNSKLSDFGGFPCDGIWLVQTAPNCKSSACIMKIDELPSVYPFAQMAVSADALCTFLGELETAAKEKTGVWKTNSRGRRECVSWSMPSRYDTTMNILKWLSQQVDKQPVEKRLLQG
jgi:hypothetical protein